MPKAKKGESMKDMKSSSTKSSSQKDRELFAFLATFLSIIGFVIALVAKRDDKYVMFYAKQSLVLFIVSVIIGIARMILYWIPVIGMLIGLLLSLGLLVLWILSWVYALSGKEKEVPLIGEWAKKINL